jgi:hypothetical protein
MLSEEACAVALSMMKPSVAVGIDWQELVHGRGIKLETVV